MKRTDRGQHPKIGICALCLLERDLCQSHIIPEFAYKPIYDDKHKMITFEPTRMDAPWREQKGFRDRLLCSDCEGFLNTSYEDPFNKLWFSGKTLETRPALAVATLHGLDYSTFKLFHLSVLWRASVCKHPAFHRVELGPHNDRIRRMLIAGHAGPASDYPIICAVIINESVVAFNLLTSPRRLRFQGHIGYDFAFAGCQWLYYVSSHRNAGIENLALKESGILPVHRRDLGAVFRSHFAFANGARRPG